jgi:hypothetical protein
MHNLHDDVIGAYFLLKEYVAGGSLVHNSPFSLNHSIMLLDPYEATDSSDFIVNFKPHRFVFCQIIR